MSDYLYLNFRDGFQLEFDGGGKSEIKVTPHCPPYRTSSAMTIPQAQALHIMLREWLLKTIPVVLEKVVMCPRCNGDGEEPGSGRTICTSCGGTGVA